MYSSLGPATIFFPAPETRNVPNISSLDGVRTRVGQLGFFSNPFFGTSAAAPHVAAIAALLWQSNPTLTSSQVVQAITQTAVDLGAPGFDTTFGFGRIDAFQAVLAFRVSPANAFVTRLYQQVLSRNPDQLGLAYWVQQLQQDGASALTVFGFFLSTEFLNRHTTDDQFLHILYRTFLDREPDPNGYNFLLAELQSGRRTRENLLDGFMFAPEFVTLASFLPTESRLIGFVTLLYLRILNRNPDPAGIQFFLAQLQQNHALLPTIQHFLASPEFQGRGTSNTEFVTILYRLILRRSPDAAGLTYWTGLLDQGATTRPQLVAQFSTAPEFQAIERGLFP